MTNRESIYRKISVAAASVLLVICTAVKCHHEDEFIGPEYKFAGQDFQVLEPVPPATSSFYASIQNPDFSTSSDTVKFNANFSAKVSWYIDLVGLSSGARKKFSGISQDLQTEKDLFWTGNSDDIIPFHTGENIVATLSFFGTTMTCKDTINLLSAIVPMHVIKVVNDFESSSPGGIPAGGPPYWYASSDSGESKSNGVLFKTVLSDKRVPDGSKFFHMEGVDLNNNADIQRVGFKGDLTSYQIPAYSNPDSIYFNIYVYGFGVVNSKFRVVFNEDDNGDGIYGGIAPPFSPLNPDPDIEDEYSYSFKADWKGWRLLSFKYSDAVLSDKAPNGTQGNHVREPHKIINMAFALMSDPAWQSARLAFDYPVFTYGYPFDPNH